MHFFKSFCLLLIYFQRITSVLTQFNMTTYRRMPQLYNFDNYDACLDDDNRAGNRSTGATYCVVYAEIVPNDTSTLWQDIKAFSADSKRHFRHDHLYFGVCLERCKHLLHAVTKFRLRELASAGRVHEVEILNYYINVHKRPTDERIRYEQFISSCLNYDFQKSYGLQLRASIEYCEKSDVTLEHDTLDIIVYAIFACIGVAIIFSTLYDFRLKTRQSSNNFGSIFYKTELSKDAQKLLTAFSLCRNYYRLTRAPTNYGAHKTAEDLQFFDALRVIGVFLVIFAHTLMLFMAMQIQNPEFFEKFFYRAETSIIENGAAIIQIFFVMSGFLLYVNFMERQLVTPSTGIVGCIWVYFKIFIYRYLRLLPSLIMLILFDATILVRLQDGPFWRHYAEAERTFCREYWWKNVFFVNNYLMRESCSHQTWYLAADMQLFELFLLTVIVMAKYPRLKTRIFATLLFLAIAIIAVLTYTLNLKAIYHSNPENYRYMFFRDAATFYQAYTPFYTNIGGYLFGFWSAELYLKHRLRGSQLRGVWRYELSWWLVFPAGFALLFTGGFFMAYDFGRASVWVALFAGLYRNLWVIICCCTLLGLCFKVGWVAYEVCCQPFFRPLGKLSYQAYLWHLVSLRLLGGFYRQPIYINRFSLICNIVMAFILTNVIAFIFALAVEFPMAEITKCLLGKYRASPAKQESGKDDITLS